MVLCVSSGGMIEQWWFEGAVSRGSMCVQVVACVSSGGMREHWWNE